MYCLLIVVWCALLFVVRCCVLVVGFCVFVFVVENALCDVCELLVIVVMFLFVGVRVYINLCVVCYRCLFVVVCCLLCVV